MTKLVLKKHTQPHNVPTDEEFTHNCEVIVEHVKKSLAHMYKQINDAENGSDGYLMLATEVADDCLDSLMNDVAKKKASIMAGAKSVGRVQ